MCICNCIRVNVGVGEITKQLIRKDESLNRTESFIVGPGVIGTPFILHQLITCSVFKECFIPSEGFLDVFGLSEGDSVDHYSRT